jgi:hypothetical protein
MEHVIRQGLGLYVNLHVGALIYTMHGGYTIFGMV